MTFWYAYSGPCRSDASIIIKTALKKLPHLTDLEMLDSLDSKLLLNLSHVPQVIWVDSSDRHFDVVVDGCSSSSGVALAQGSIRQSRRVSALRLTQISPSVV